jgi:integrase
MAMRAARYTAGGIELPPGVYEQRDGSSPTGQSYYVVLPVKRNGAWKTVQLPGKHVPASAWARSAKAAILSALKAKDDARGRSSRGQAVGRQRMALGDYFDEWIESRVNVREATRQGYRQTFDRYIRPALGGTELQAITGEDLGRLYKGLLSTLSPSTVALVSRTLNKVLEDARRSKRIPENPNRDAEKPSKPAPEPHPWPAEDVSAFLAAIRGDRFYALWRLPAFTGLRRGELLGLTWGCIDLDGPRPKLRVEAQLIESDGTPGVPRYSKSEPKTLRGRRDIPLEPSTVETLRQWRKAQLEERMAAGEAWRQEPVPGLRDLVWTWEDGSPVSPNWASTRFKVLTREAGVWQEHRDLHSLRDTFATLCLNPPNPWPITAVSRSLATQTRTSRSATTLGT